jgi:hypothetical protein
MGTAHLQSVLEGKSRLRTLLRRLGSFRKTPRLVRTDAAVFVAGLIAVEAQRPIAVREVVSDEIPIQLHSDAFNFSLGFGAAVDVVDVQHQRTRLAATGARGPIEREDAFSIPRVVNPQSFPMFGPMQATVFPSLFLVRLIVAATGGLIAFLVAIVMLQRQFLHAVRMRGLPFLETGTTATDAFLIG